jgi:hypothetical protein
MSWLSGLGLPTSLTSVIGLAVGMYIFKTASSGMDPAMAQWTPQFLAYAGDLIALVASQLAAAYAGVKAIEAAVHFDKGFYYTYAGASSTGNLLGLWELLSVILFLTWSLGISIVGYVEGALLWERYEAMETVGQTVTIVEGYKYLALGCVIGVGAWISGLALGDSADKLLGFFDEYADDTHSEATDKDGNVDPDGTAIVYDLGFHFVTLLFSYLTISAIAIGAYAFGYTYLGQGDAAADAAAAASG